MSPTSLAPEQDLHFVLCAFGRSSHAYVETDPTQADASTIVRKLLDGQYNRPVRVLALNVEEGWVRDVSGFPRKTHGATCVGGALLAHRVNSRQRSTPVTCGAKRTFSEPQLGQDPRLPSIPLTG
jgi:hypothetical protein